MMQERERPHPPVALAGNDAEAVVFDLVQPLAAGGQHIGFGREARRDEPGRKVTLQHVEQIKLGNGDCNFELGGKPYVSQSAMALRQPTCAVASPGPSRSHARRVGATWMIGVLVAVQMPA